MKYKKGHFYYLKWKWEPFEEALVKYSGRQIKEILWFEALAGTHAFGWADISLEPKKSSVTSKEVPLCDLPLYISWPYKTVLYEEYLKNGCSKDKMKGKGYE